MKEYQVQVDIVMSAFVYVNADSEEQAKAIADERVSRDPYDYKRDAYYVSHEVIDACE